MPWLLVFFLTPIAEMYLLIEVAGYIDTLPTIFLVMVTAVIGVALLKRQGLATLTRGLGRMNRGEIPAREMAEGVLLGIAGALLLTPGFITDTVGFVLLFPPTRIVIANHLLKRVQVHSFAAGGEQSPFQDGFVSPTTDSSDPSKTETSKNNATKPVTLEGDFERK